LSKIGRNSIVNISKTKSRRYIFLCTFGKSMSKLTKSRIFMKKIIWQSLLYRIPLRSFIYRNIRIRLCNWKYKLCSENQIPTRKIRIIRRRVWKYQMGHQNPYIEGEQTMAKRKSTKGQTTIYKILHIKLKIE
jgi:hypothetical protein